MMRKDNLRDEMINDYIKHDESCESDYYKKNCNLNRQVDKLLRERVALNKCLLGEQEKVRNLQDENQKLRVIVDDLKKENKTFCKDLTQREKTDHVNKTKHNFYEEGNNSKTNADQQCRQNTDMKRNVGEKVQHFNRLATEKHNGETAFPQLHQQRLKRQTFEPRNQNREHKIEQQIHYNKFTTVKEHEEKQRQTLLHENCMGLEHEVDKLQRENIQLRKELGNVNNETIRYKKEYIGIQFDKVRDKTASQIATDETQETLNKQAIELTETIKHLLQNNEVLSNENMSRQTNETVSMTKLQESNEQLKRDVDQLQYWLQDKTNNLNQVQKLLREKEKLTNDLMLENRRTQNETESIRQRNGLLQNKVSELLQEQQALKECLNSEKANVKLSEEELLKRIEDMQHKIEHKEQELAGLRAELMNRKEFVSSQKLDSNEVLQQQLTETKVRLRNAEKELDDTKSRLSRAMSDTLSDNNPNIADLSDKNRPTKISERYQELYDNQWTDAFQIIDKSFGDQEKTIQVLKEILLETMEFCKTEAANQMIHLQATLLKGEECSPSVYKQAKDIRKAVAERFGKGLYKEYCTSLSKTPFATQIPNFVKECFEVCWLMVVQDPPVVFGPNIRRHDVFNKDHYKSYTRSGDRIDYVVWPVLLLHLNGPVLCKGVAQGKEA